MWDVRWEDVINDTIGVIPKMRERPLTVESLWRQTGQWQSSQRRGKESERRASSASAVSVKCHTEAVKNNKNVRPGINSC